CSTRSVSACSLSCTFPCWHDSSPLLTSLVRVVVFFFNDPAPTEIYTLSLHDALPIYPCGVSLDPRPDERADAIEVYLRQPGRGRSEEHTSELQSRENLVCRLLLEKKKNATNKS